MERDGPRGAEQFLPDQGRLLVREGKAERGRAERGDGRPDGAAAEVLPQLGVGRLQRQVDRGEEREEHQREQPDAERKRREPGRDVRVVKRARRLPRGTRPAAMVPTHTPSSTGVTMLATAKIAPQRAARRRAASRSCGR